MAIGTSHCLFLAIEALELEYSQSENVNAGDRLLEVGPEFWR